MSLKILRLKNGASRITFDIAFLRFFHLLLMSKDTSGYADDYPLEEYEGPEEVDIQVGK